METIPVIILPDGKTAREVNIFGEKPVFKNHIGIYIGDFEDLPYYKQKAKVEDWEQDFKQWQQAESSLRTFVIDQESLDKKVFESFKNGIGFENIVRVKNATLKEGSIHTAEVLDNGKIKIV